MSSFLWLLLYLAPLLGLTAATFGWLGWRWHRTDLRRQLHDLQARMDEMHAARSAGEVEHDALRDQVRAAAAETTQLRDDLQTARTAIDQGRGESARSQELNQSLKSELARALQERDILRTEREQGVAALAAAQGEIERLRAAPPEPAAPPPSTLQGEPSPSAGPKRPRQTSATPKIQPRATAARLASLQDTLAVVESQLTTHRPTVTALTQERDDWQRRVTKLESQTIADPAGLGLAYRSLADSEKRLQAASSEIDRLENQSRVLRRMQEQAAALSAVADDDLTRIKGIKSVISEQLRAHGVRTWRQIAQWNDDELRAFSELLAFKNRATREKWKEQARALHEATHGPL